MYLWVEAGRVKTMRPARLLWLYLPDLLRVERETANREKGKQ